MLVGGSVSGSPQGQRLVDSVGHLSSQAEGSSACEPFLELGEQLRGCLAGLNWFLCLKELG